LTTFPYYFRDLMNRRKYKFHDKWLGIDNGGKYCAVCIRNTDKTKNEKNRHTKKF